MKKRSRAPKGYRIQQWADGTYHVYAPDGGCIEEVLSHREALQVARTDAETRRAVKIEAILELIKE